jgi:hypothetical protein
METATLDRPQTTRVSLATTRQTWAIFCLSGYDVRAAGLSLERASHWIDWLKSPDKSAALATIAATPGAVQKGKAKVSGDEHAALFDKAHAAGMAAGNATVPTPIMAVQHANPLNDNSAVVQQWYVPQGSCGHAWVIVRPGNCSFANWLKKNGHGKASAYHGGVMVWASEFGQSVEKKSAYAGAFAKVLHEAGIRAHSYSRDD